MSKQDNCPLCEADGGALIWRGDKLRVIRAQEAGFPGFYRVVWNEHAAEFSDLSAADRGLCMEAVTVVERVLREQLAPAKINLAALGNMVAHLHWHVIARYEWDSQFPAAIWAPAQRERDEAREAELIQKLPLVDEALQQALNHWAA